MFTRDPYSMQGQQINSSKQALSQAEMHAEVRHHAELGKAYTLTSGFVTSSATGDTFASILYIKNTSETEVLFLGLTALGSEVAGKWKIVRNPTSISNSTAITPLNMNHNSPATLTATVEYGSATSTTTAGDDTGHYIVDGPGHEELPLDGAIQIGPNSSITFEFAPFASAAGEVCVTIDGWQVAPDA